MASQNSRQDNFSSVCIFCANQVVRKNEKKSEQEFNTYLTNALKLLIRKSPTNNPVTTTTTLSDNPNNCVADEENPLGEYNGDVSLCVDCNGITVVALESRSKAEQLEVEVRMLQKQLLELLRKLQEEMEQFSQQMTRIEGKVKSASVEPFANCQDKVLRVRDRILEVMTDLRFSQSDLHDKFILLNRMEKGEGSSEEELTFETVPDEEMNFTVQQDVEVVTCDASLLEEGSEEDDLTPTNYVGHTIGTRDYDGAIEQEEGSEDAEMGEYQDSIFFSSLLYTYPPKNNDTSSSRPSSPRKNGKVKPAKFKSVNLSRMCSFKKGLIKRAMEREMKRKQYEDYHENPLIRYFLRFDPPSDTFFVGHIQVKLREESGRILDCMGMGCGTSWTPQANNEHTTFDRDIRNHVIGKHLGGFTCRVCNLILDSYFKLMSHFKRQHPGQKPLNDLDLEKCRHQPPTTSRGRLPVAPASGSRREPKYKTLDRFRRKSNKFPKRLREEGECESVPSPSEGLKQVRMTMKSAIESLGDQVNAVNAGPPDILEPPAKKSKRVSNRSKSAVQLVEPRFSITLGGGGGCRRKDRKKI